MFFPFFLLRLEKTKSEVKERQKMSKKGFLTFVCVVVLCTLVSGEGGTGGDNLTWSLDGGVLRISGTGDMDKPCGISSSHAKRIQSVVIEEGVTSILESTFDQWRLLFSVTLPDKLISIGNSSFSGCQSLSIITIPRSVRFIGSYAFANCSNLTTVHFLGGTDPGADSVDVFQGCDNLDTIFVPVGYGNKEFCGRTDYFVAHTVTCKGEVNGTWTVKDGSKLEDIKDIALYFKAKGYVFGDEKTNKIVW